MVSFQCDACTDVVKKPKLDRHYGQCHASFTCIDCSATFSGPPQWKGHTTCITEAEKYQKSLYKGAKKGQDARPSNGNHRNAQVSKIPGKYHQSQNNQQSWSRRQYAPNYVSGANTTPLGSPPRMSPVDSSPVDSPGNAPETEPKVGKKRDSGVIVEADASNAAQPKPKKKKRHDDAKRPEVALPQEPPSVVNGHRKSKEGSKAETEPSLAPEKDRGEKKSKKRKRKEGDGDGSNAIEQTDATSNDKPEDEKKAKKRKHKEKREDDSPSKQNDVPDEVVATNGEEVKEKAKKRKKSKEKGDEVSPKTEIVEKTRKKRKKSESST